jgi:hypothetical protein
MRRGGTATHPRTAFRRRALSAGVVAGAIALGGLAVVREDASSLFEGLTEGGGLVALLASAVAGIATLALVARSRKFEPARYTAAVAVAAIVAGWGMAQKPDVPPGLTVQEAAAEPPTLSRAARRSRGGRAHPRFPPSSCFSGSYSQGPLTRDARVNTVPPPGRRITAATPRLAVHSDGRRGRRDHLVIATVSGCG